MSKRTYRFNVDKMSSLISSYYEKLGRKVEVYFEYGIIYTQDEIISRCIATEYKFIPNTGEVMKLHFIISKDEIKHIINCYLSKMNMSLIDLSNDAYVVHKKNKAFIGNKTYTVTALCNKNDFTKKENINRNKSNSLCNEKEYTKILKFDRNKNN